jgi:hypothetical protein
MIVKPIKELFAFVAMGPLGEGIVMAESGPFKGLLMATDEARLESIRPIATQAAKEMGITIRLIKLSGRVELAVLGREIVN